MCNCDDFPAAEFCDIRTVTARKRPRCCECLADILPGEKHEYASGKWEGYFDSFRTCAQCVAARVAMKLKCWCYGEVAREADETGALEPEAKAMIERRRVNCERLKREKQECGL